MLKKSALFIFSILYTPLAYALDSPFGSPGDFGEFLGTVGKVMHSLVTNQYSSFFILAIILFILLYNIFRAPLQKIPVFEGAPGKSIAVALTLLAELGLFYKSRETGIGGLLSGIFGANNLFVGIVIAVLLFLFWRKSLGNRSNNKIALFFTGISCFALDSLLQTPLMSTIGLSLIIISGIWFIGSKTRANTGKTFTKRFKKEWKATKKLEKEGKKKVKSISKYQKEEENIAENVIEYEKKELNLYEELAKRIEEQIKSKNPGEYLTEVQSLLKQLHDSLEESTHLYTEEKKFVAEEIRKLEDEESIEGEIISHEDVLKEISSIEITLTEKIEEEEKISKKIAHLQKVVEKDDIYQKKLLSELGFINKELQKRLYSIEALQERRKFRDSYNEVKKISGLFSERGSIIKKKKDLLDKELKLTRIIKHFQKRQGKDTTKVRKLERGKYHHKMSWDKN